MDYLVTIVIPTYRRPNRIVRCVESALKQTCHKEIIVVDDNGNGTAEQIATEQALQSFLADSQIQYLVNDKNSGGSFTRNQGLNAASGHFITFLDDDDEIDPRKLSIQAEALIEAGKEYSCCMCGYHKLMGNGTVYTSGEHCFGDVYRYALGRSIYNGSGSNLLVRTAVAKEIGGYDVRFKRNQDLEFMSRLLKGYKLALVKDDLLTIHYEIREVKRSYKELVDIDQFYFDVFKNDIEILPEQQKKAIYQVAALERWRYSISRHEMKDAFKNMKQNKVPMVLFFRYINYLFDRVIRKKSYGFKPY